MAWAVSAMTGMVRVAGSALSRRVASQPSTAGRLMSIRIRSGPSDRAAIMPSSPSTASATWKPRRCSRRDNMSRFISLSSTSRIFMPPWLRGYSKRIGREDAQSIEHRPGSSSQADNVVGWDRPLKALQRQFADELRFGQVLDGRVNALTDQDLSVARLATQTRRKIDDRAVRTVVTATLEADLADRGVAQRQPDAEAEPVSAPTPPRL